MSNESKPSGILKWTEDTYLWKANTPRPKTVHDIDLESKKCIWCGAGLDRQSYSTHTIESNSTYFTGLNQCDVCGWYIERSGWYNHSSNCQEISGVYNFLRKFNINNEEVSIQELGTFLKLKFSDVHNVTPNRMEKLVEDIFKNLGYRTRLTQQTHDKGADIFLLDDGSGQQAMVQVKKYRKDRTVGVHLVRELIGAQILLAVRKGFLVTSSFISPFAVTASQSSYLQEHNIEVELWDGLRLLKELSCYNEGILPIDSINPDIPMIDQVPPELRTKKRILRAPWPGFSGKRVSHLEGDDLPA